MARPQLSQEYVQDSASEAQSEDSSSGSEDENEQEVDTGASTPLDAAAGVNSDSESESSSDSDTGVNGIKRKSKTQQHAIPNKRSKSNPAYIPSRPYQPPQGYLAIKSNFNHAIMNRLKSDGVQIWHITAPSSVPLTKVKSFDIQAALQGEPIFEYNGIKYNMQTMTDSPETLLMPSENLVSTGNGSEVTVAYRDAATHITKGFSLHATTSVESAAETAKQDTTSTTSRSSLSSQDAIVTSDIGLSKLEFFATTIGKMPEPRQQPSGLLKRYHPYGSGSIGKERMRDPAPATISGEDDDSVDDNGTSESVQNGFVAPPSPPPESDMEIDEKSKKRKSHKKRDKHKNHEQGSQSQESKTKRKEFGKEKRLHQIQPDTMDIDTSHVVMADVKKKEKKKEKHKRKEKRKAEV